MLIISGKVYQESRERIRIVIFQKKLKYPHYIDCQNTLYKFFAHRPFLLPDSQFYLLSCCNFTHYHHSTYLLLSRTIIYSTYISIRLPSELLIYHLFTHISTPIDPFLFLFRFLSNSHPSLLKNP